MVECLTAVCWLTYMYFPCYFFLLKMYSPVLLYLRLLSQARVGEVNPGSQWLSVAGIIDLNADIRALGREVVDMKFFIM